MTFADLIAKFIDIINPILTLLVAVAMLVFFKGLVGFIAKSGDEKSHAEGRSLMVWGLIALFVMVSTIGILRFAFRDLGLGGTFAIPTLPQNK